MEIKAKLTKPFNKFEKIDFIVEYNHNLGYQIQETPDALEAWGKTFEEIQEQEAQSLSQLKLTKREVFLALYEDSGITPDEIKLGITNPASLIEFEYANEYYRGNPLIDLIGASLGYTKDDLDYLFLNKHFPVKEVHVNA